MFARQKWCREKKRRLKQRNRDFSIFFSLSHPDSNSNTSNWPEQNTSIRMQPFQYFLHRVIARFIKQNQFVMVKNRLSTNMHWITKSWLPHVGLPYFPLWLIKVALLPLLMMNAFVGHKLCFPHLPNIYIILHDAVLRTGLLLISTEELAQQAKLWPFTVAAFIV